MYVPVFRAACNEEGTSYPVTQCNVADGAMAGVEECARHWNGTSCRLCSVLPLH